MRVTSGRWGGLQSSRHLGLQLPRGTVRGVWATERLLRAASPTGAQVPKQMMAGGQREEEGEASLLASGQARPAGGGGT